MSFGFHVGRFGVRASLSPFNVEIRSNVQEPDRWLVEYAGGHPTASGQVMTERTSVQISDVFCAVDLIGNSIATSPLRLYQKMKDGTRREAFEHPVYKIFQKPNPEMTKFTFWKTLMGHRLLWGNYYCEIERNGAGIPIGLWPLAPDRTFPKRKRGVGGAPDGPLVYISRSSSGPEIELMPWEVLHDLGYSYDGLRGLSPIALHRETLGLSMAATDYGARFFGNDARPGGVLEHPGKLKNEAARRLKESWDEAHRGGAQSHRIAVLEDGMKFNTITMPNDDAQYLGTRVFQTSEVARIFHIPLHKLAELSHATFTNIESQEIEYVTDAVMPPAGSSEAELARKLLTDRERSAGYYAAFNLDGHMRGDLHSRYQAYEIAWKNGWMSADDIAELENRNPLPDGQGKTYFVPVVEQPMAKALAAPPAAAGSPGVPGKTGAAPAPGAGKAPAGGPPALPPLPPGTLPGSWLKLHDATGDKGAWDKWVVASLRDQMIEAYAPMFELVFARLKRKESAALQRMHTQTERDKFITEHSNYVTAAILPVLEAVKNSLEGLEGTLREGFEKEYREAFVHRYLESVRMDLSSPDPHYEATRAANAFAQEIYIRAGITKFAVIRCKSCIEAKRGENSAVHPPFARECRCQIVPGGEEK